MDLEKLRSRIFCENSENRVEEIIGLLNSVEPRKISNTGISWFDRIFLPGDGFAVRPLQVLPFELVGGRNDTAMLLPVFGKGLFLLRCFDSCIDNRLPHPVEMVAPDHRIDSFLAV